MFFNTDIFFDFLLCCCWACILVSFYLFEGLVEKAKVEVVEACSAVLSQQLKKLLSTGIVFHLESHAVGYS